jgi:hypothetical protein
MLCHRIGEQTESREALVVGRRASALPLRKVDKGSTSSTVEKKVAAAGCMAGYMEEK